MSLEDEDQHFPDQIDGASCEEKKKVRLSYTRDFLLSFSDLDVCKKLPRGFNPSILTEFEGFSSGLQDRQRLSGGLSLQSFKRTDFSSSPPTRGDSSNYSRGIHGRWDSRSRDSDSQSDWDSDSGRRYGNRRWQNPEHDGLLGSGSFPRPSGYAAGTSAPKFRANDPGQLNRSNEPYQPPRPYKAVPHSRRDTQDLLNDETFGSAEFTSEDRAEEEKKRRASFELMRKEQHKAFQEKQKSNSDKHKDDSVADTTAVLEDSKEEKSFLKGNNKTDDSLMILASQNDSSKSLLPSQTLASRPLVPPGFTSTVFERNFETKSVVHPHPTEDGNSEIDDRLLHAIGNPLLNGTSDNQEAKQLGQKMTLSDQQLDNKSIDIPLEKFKIPFLVSEVSNKTTGMDNQSYKTSSLSETSDTVNGEIIELDTEKGIRENIVSSQDNSSSILEKIFGSALRVKSGGSSNLTEHHDNKTDQPYSPSTEQSSKFAHWFLEDDKKPVDDLSSGKTHDLLSFIVSGEEAGFQVSDTKATEQIPPDFPFHHSDLSNRDLTSELSSSIVGVPEHANKPEAAPAVLTCEDLEQSMLSEISDKSSILQPPVQGWSGFEGKVDQPKTKIDDRASQHLLSLLHKGPDLNDMVSSPSLDTEASDKLRAFELSSTGTAHYNSREVNSQKADDVGKNLALETLFGSAFMNELQLQSGEAPVSVHRGSVGSARVDVPESHGLLFPGIDNGLPASIVGETGSDWTGHGSSILTLNHSQKTESDKIEGHWSSFNDPRTKVNSSRLKTEVGSKFGGFDGAVDVRLPEEDSLIMVGDSVNHPNSIHMPAGELIRAEILSSLSRPVGVSEKLAALNAVYRDERSMVGSLEGSHFLRGPSHVMEPEIRYQNLHAQPSSSQFRPPQINHGRPLFHPLDSHPAHINAQMKFPDSIMHHDHPSNYHPSANMLRPPFRHPNTGLTGFDPPAHHPMLQQMQMPGNFPPSHMLQGFPGATPLPPHPNNQATGFIRESDTMQGFPTGHRPSNFGGLGMPLPVPDIGGVGNHPEALQRLIEMELRSNPKQIHHPLAPSQGQGMYGHELDMSFRYR